MWRDVVHAPDADSALALVAFLALVVDPITEHKITHVTPVVVVLSVVTALPLTARRRHPLGVLALVVPLLLVCLAVFHPNSATVGVTMCLVFTVGMEGDRLRSLLVGGLMAPVVASAVLLTSPGHRVELLEFVAYLALVLGSLAAGEAVRARGALTRAIAEDAARERIAQTQAQGYSERLGLANEVHDIVGHALVAIQVQASAAAHLQRRNPGTTSPETMDGIAATAAEALADLRSTPHDTPHPGRVGPTAPGSGRDRAPTVAERCRGRGSGRPVGGRGPCARHRLPGGRPRRLPDRPGGSDERPAALDGPVRAGTG